MAVPVAQAAAQNFRKTGKAAGVGTDRSFALTGHSDSSVERVTSFVLEFTTMTLNLEIHTEVQGKFTVPAELWIFSKGAWL